MMRTVGVAALGMSSVALLGGCTTMQGEPRYAYYRVPCNTPGAVVATPVTLQPASGAAPSRSPSATAVVAPEASCVVAVSDVSSGRGRSYYPGYGGYSGRSFYGSVGFGFGLGGHGGGHGFSGGHHSGHHR